MDVCSSSPGGRRSSVACADPRGVPPARGVASPRATSPDGGTPEAGQELGRSWAGCAPSGRVVHRWACVQGCEHVCKDVSMCKVCHKLTKCVKTCAGKCADMCKAERVQICASLNIRRDVWRFADICSPQRAFVPK